MTKRMPTKELYYKWEWNLQAEPQAIWPFFADTNRVNRDTGLFPLAQLDRQKGERLPGGQRRLRYHLPVPYLYLDYEEEPFEWIFPHRYGVVRHFHNKLVSTFRVSAEMNPRPGGGTHLVYESWIQPRNVLGAWGTAVAIGKIAPRRFDKAIRAYDRLAVAAALPVFAKTAQLAAGGSERLAQMQAALAARGMEPDLVARLAKLIQWGDEFTLSRLRPYQFADLWSAERKKVLELFLEATRIGLLDFQWEVLCPMCRGAEDRVSAHLSDVHTEAHCFTCNIDFRANFENAVELTFTPNPAIRDVPGLDFCVAGPEVTPHIVMQQTLPPDHHRLVMPLLEPGRYRLRTMAQPGGQYLRVVDNGRDQIPIVLDGRGWPTDELPLAPMPRLELANRTPEAQTVILERTTWSDQATTAAEVFALQRFRDLFANEALRPGEQIGVGSLTVLFTDLVDSTRMYREIGDAPAFGLVMNHFDVLRAAIDAEQGAIVKTIGDAVMAVFRRPIAALRAMQTAQAQLSNPPEGLRPLQLKAAAHTGHSIAVTLNERLDYFGTTINIASRLEKFARANEIIISDNLYHDPEVQAYLQNAGSALAIEEFDEMLKGFDNENFHLWRITARV
ncbi:MAG: adenylate/guanylate cyclase domain-containing protein [Chloroflexi bacterium]|nr:adenylate/guanylate cyclase domain-containing protein [Ardenticatenaceae bacterium]NOG34715.1 adenylate/guanylate cyclase domain-containing protein [Chloroflexota bacterium]